MLKKFLNIQWVAVVHTLIGLFLVEVLSKYQWSNYAWLLAIGGIGLVILYGWIAKRFLEGNIYMISIAALLYIGYWFGLYYLGFNFSKLINPMEPGFAINLLSMSINLVYFWIIISGGIIGYISIFKQKRRDYQVLYSRLAEMNRRN